MRDLVLLLPTRDRPNHCKRTFESISDTADELDRITVKMWLDKDEPRMNEYEDLIVDTEINVDYNIYPRKVHLGFMYNYLWKHSNGDVYQMLNDDALFKTKGWDMAIDRALDKYSDDILMLFCNPVNSVSNKPVLLFDSWYDQSPGLYFLTDKVAQVLGYFCWIEGQRNFNETWIEDIFYHLYDLTGEKRIEYLDEYTILHDSVKSGGIEIDQTFRQLENQRSVTGEYFTKNEKVQERREEAKKLRAEMNEITEGSNT